jgi:uncharacterized membrane protein
MSDPTVPPKPPSDDEPRTGAPGATGGAGTPPPPGGAGPGAPPPPGPGYGAGHGAGAPPPPPATPPPGGESGNRQLMLILSYLWILALVPYLTEQRDPEVKWHARHGLVLLIAEVILGVIFFILGLIPVLNCLFGVLSIFVWLGIIVLHVLCLVKALQGERFKIPYVSQYADQIP